MEAGNDAFSTLKSLGASPNYKSVNYVFVSADLPVNASCQAERLMFPLMAFGFSGMIRLGPGDDAEGLGPAPVFHT